MYALTKTAILSALLLSSSVYAMPAAEAGAVEPLEKRGSFNAVVWSGKNCNSGDQTPESGNAGGCITQGGQSVNIQLNGGCSWYSYSGIDCAGSRKKLSGGCNKVTFGSMLVMC